jgi:hypothetical protein
VQVDSRVFLDSENANLSKDVPAGLSLERIVRTRVRTKGFSRVKIQQRQNCNVYVGQRGWRQVLFLNQRRFRRAAGPSVVTTFVRTPLRIVSVLTTGIAGVTPTFRTIHHGLLCRQSLC